MTRTFASLVAVGALALSACADNTNDDATESAAAATAGSIVDDATSALYIFSNGGGAMPVGQPCIPGYAFYTVNFDAGFVSGSRCEADADGVVTTRYRQDALTAADAAEIRARAKAVTVSAKTTCDTGSKPLLNMYLAARRSIATARRV